MDRSIYHPQLIEYVAKYEVFYCHACCSVYVLNQLDLHLKQKHAITREARQRMIEHCQALPLPLAVRDRAASYRQPARENSSLPVPFLPILEGFACSHCTCHDPWYSTNRKAVQEHINQVHRLFGTAGTAGLRPAKLQTWYSSNRAQYWEVATASPPAPAPATSTATATPPLTRTRTETPLRAPPSSTLDPAAATRLEELEEEEHRRLEQLASNHEAADNEVEADETTPWLTATEWPQQFARRPLDLIAGFAKHPAAVAVAVAAAADGYRIGPFQEIELISPAQDEERLQQISWLFSLVFDQGIRTLQETPYQIRCWLKSYSPHEFFPRPFNQLQKPGTRHRYQRQWQWFLCFCFRAWRLDPALRQRVFGPALDLTPYDAQMRQIWDLLDQAERAPLSLPLPRRQVDSDAEESTRDPNPKPWHIVPSALRDMLVDRVRELSWQFLITPIPQHHRHYHYPLLYFVGVLGIHPESLAYRTAYQFTPTLAGLLWVSRLLLLEYAQQPRSSLHASPPSGSSGSGSSDGGSSGDIEHFRTIQSRYLCRESISATSHLLRFLAYGRQLAQNEGPRANISWAPDYQALTLFSSRSQDDLGSGLIQLADFRKMVTGAIRHCHRLTQEMMLGWEPTVDLSSLRDDLTNSTAGYSYLSEPANQLQSAFEQLLRRAWDGDLQARGQWQ